MLLPVWIVILEQCLVMAPADPAVYHHQLSFSSCCVFHDLKSLSDDILAAVFPLISESTLYIPSSISRTA